MVLWHTPSHAILHGLRISFPVDLCDLGLILITCRQKLKIYLFNQSIFLTSDSP